MDTTVFLAVLTGAAMHAGWNALLKLGGDRMAVMAFIAIGHGIPAVLALPFVGALDPAAWPFLIASMALHVGYRIFLVKAYEAGDMSQVYPLARGSAPLLTAVIGIVFLGEDVRLLAILGIVTIGLGIVLMSLRGGADLKRMNGHALAFALITAGFICAYTLADGLGARAALNPHAYAAWLFAIDAPVTVALVFALRGRRVLNGMREHALKGLMGGLLSLGSYWIAIWAMTKVPIPQVAALRETSVLFGLLIAVCLLGEKLTPPRAVAAALILLGAGIMRIG
jgi:drug/metabolite transporter (DMT)-like permease